MIYLASPYSDPDQKVRKARYEAACRAAAEIMLNGRYVFCPVVHGHGIALCGVDGGWNTWSEFDRWFIERCDEVKILMLPGWGTSSGIAAEIALAEAKGKPITYMEVVE